MMMLRAAFLLIFFFRIICSLHSQQFGGNPPSIKWRQVNNETIRVIFPTGLDSLAQEIADISIRLGSSTNYSIGKGFRKINIVLQNQTTVSNGYVSLGPYRSEFQLTPDPNSFSLGSLPWSSSLAIHEYRHVQQYNNFRKGMATGFYILFGEEGQALANALTVPDWFFEGDAVMQETLVSKQGRGRLPYFMNGYCALWIAGKNYSYMKLRNGSLKDFVPNHYPLGYMFVSYGREKFGPEFWKNVSSDAAAWKGFFYPWQKAVEAHAGINFKEFREQAFSFFNSSKEQVATDAGHFIADEEYPHWVDTNAIVYLKSTFKRIPRFMVRIKDAERKVRVRDLSIDNYFSYNNGKIVYASYKPDIRWGWRDYSELKILNIHDNSQRTLTKKTKYFSPDISPDGDHIVAVHVGTNGENELHILNAADGSLEKKIPNPGKLFYTYPKFYARDKIVSAVRDQTGRMSIVIIDHTNGSSEFIIPYSWAVIGFPSIDRSSIYFTASYQGRDQLFRWENGQLSIISSKENPSNTTGEYQLNVRKNKSVWTKFTASGYRLIVADSTEINPRPLDLQAFGDSISTFGIRVVTDSLNNFLSSISNNRYPVRKYSKSFQLFKFHSRRPYISDPDYSFSFVSENILNTLQSEFFLSYNRNENFKEIGFSAVYGGWFPMLRIGSQFTIDRNARINANSQRAYWNEWENSIGFTIPLNLSGGRTYTYLKPGADFVYNKRYFTGLYKDSLENSAFGYINASLTFSNQVQQARQHIHPRFAQSISLNYKKTVTDIEGSQFLASGSFYLPGLFPNHSLVLQAAWHTRDTLNDIRFSNSFPFSRGYSTNNFSEMWKLGANYHFPLFYPDWGFGNIIYFLRIRTNLFFDYSRIRDYNTARQEVQLDFRSTGTEIFFDTSWWNQLPISFGFRYSRLLDQDLEGRGPNQFEFVLPVNLLNR